MLSRPLSRPPCARPLMLARQLHPRTRCRAHTRPLMLTRQLHARTQCCLRAIPLTPARLFRARLLMLAHQLPNPLSRARSCCAPVPCAHPFMLTRVPVDASAPVQRKHQDEGWCPWALSPADITRRGPRLNFFPFFCSFPPPIGFFLFFLFLFFSFFCFLSFFFSFFLFFLSIFSLFFWQWVCGVPQPSP
jgi:hypothetical protein